MRRLLWPLLVFVLCLPVALLALGYRLPGLSPAAYAAPVAVPDGDREIAWFHTTTSVSTWERFVAGAQRAARLLPGLTADVSAAFSDQTTDVPEVVLGLDGKPGRLRVRWYKLSSDHRARYWAEALARRDPPPLAVIGGGSSDRARDLAWALAQQASWRGDRPLFLVTTATAEKVFTDAEEAGKPDHAGRDTPLVKVYDGRTFRFCFGNRQMAEAMLDFVWRHPALRPESFAAAARQAVAGGAAARPHRPAVYCVDWTDDPYSCDLLEQLGEALPAELADHGLPPDADVFRWRVPFSVGGYYAPNRAEAETVGSLLKELAARPAERALLVVPTVPAPARRFLRTLAEADPTVGRRLVAVNGDGMGVNTVLRDGEFAWPVHALPVPLLLFTHHDPAGWDDPSAPALAGPPLLPPNSTEDVLHFAEMTRALATAAYGGRPGDRLVTRADELGSRLRDLTPAFFDADGNRAGGTGEYVLLVRPRPAGANPGGLPDATAEVWKREADRSWRLTRTHPLNQSRARTGAAPAPPRGGRG